jgi:hypothetical protein
MITVKRHPLASVLISAAVFLAAIQGCSDSDNANPKPPDVNTGGSNTQGGTNGKAGSSSNGGKSGSGNKAGTAGKGEEGGTSSTDGGTSPIEAGSNDGGAGGAPPQPACDKPELGEDGCFNCPKDKKPEQWLNRCTAGDCEPFDNKARLKLLKADGSLPILPN